MTRTTLVCTSRVLRIVLGGVQLAVRRYIAIAERNFAAKLRVLHNIRHTKQKNNETRKEHTSECSERGETLHGCMGAKMTHIIDAASSRQGRGLVCAQSTNANIL